MSKGVLLLLLLAALTAACLRLGSAEGDPIPPSLVDLLQDSPISSVEDLKQLLQQETGSIEEEEEEEEEHDILVNHTHGRYTRSLVEAQPAQQAVCKVRTEVMEVTRAMLDRRNANFLLWPPCVEVQRCSGCCNTRLLQCVPTVTSTRYLQVIKIQYINKNAHYEKAIIPVEDHAGCRCQAASAAPRSPVTANANPNPPPPPPPPQPQQSTPSSPHLPPRTHHAAPPKSHGSKADLHRHDDLKRNQGQGYRQEERAEPLDRQWQPAGRYTQLAHTQPQPHWTPQQPRTHHHHPTSTHALHPLTHGQQQQPGPWSSGVRADQGAAHGGGTQQPPAREGGHGSGYDGSKEDGGARAVPGGTTAEQRHLEHTQRQQQLQYHQQQQQQQQQYEQQRQQQQQYQQQYQYRQHYSHQAYPQYNRGGPSVVGDQELRTQYRLNGPQADSASPPADDPPTRAPPNHRPPTDPEPTNQRGTSAESQRATEVKNQTRTETDVASHGGSGKEREEAGSAVSGDAATELTGPKKDRDSETSGAERPFTELERRQKLLEIVQREPENLPHLHPHHPQHRPKPEATTHKSVVTTTADPSRSSARVLPFRPALPRRRRKHRSRISKAAIRAMIM